MSTANTSQIDQLRQYMVEHGVTIQNIADAIHISRTTMSLYMSQQYSGKVELIDEKVKNYIELQQEKRSRKMVIPFVETRQVKRMFEVIQMALIEEEITVITGDAGSGKTTALREYARRWNNTTVLVEADVAYTAKILLKKICSLIGLSGKGSVQLMKEDIVETLRGREIVLIIDEAENLPLRALELLRSIYDQTHIGLVLIGMPRLLFNLKGPKDDFKQLFSRVGGAIKLNLLDEKDVLKITETVGLDKWHVEFHKLSRGNTRVLSKLISRSKRIADINKTQVSAAVIEKAASMLIF